MHGGHEVPIRASCFGDIAPSALHSILVKSKRPLSAPRHSPWASASVEHDRQQRVDFGQIEPSA